jgi:hypothetical protein
MSDAANGGMANIPSMSGIYNYAPGPYLPCTRGVEFFRALTPGTNFAAQATLVATGDPPFVLKVQSPGDHGQPSIFKEVEDGAPAGNFLSHTTCVGNYPLITPVNVMVKVTANAAGGVEINLSPV